MSQSDSTRQKRTASKSNQTVESQVHSVPRDWAQLGYHQDLPSGYARFYCERVCVEYRLEAEHVSPTELNYRERTKLLVLYRHPETREAVVREYKATAGEVNSDRVPVPHPDPDGTGRRSPGNWGRIRYDSLPHPTADGHRVVPTCVADGEPRNFRASVAVSSEEQRVDA